MSALAETQGSLVKAIAVGRVGLAAAYCLTPGLSLRAWPGRGSHADPVTRLLARSVGARDLALGIGTLMALRHHSPVRGWLEAGLVADLGDAAAIALAFRQLPRVRSLLVLGSAVGAAAAGQWVISSMSTSAGSADAVGNEGAIDA